MYNSSYFQRWHWFHPVHMKVFTHKITILGVIR